jgi:hypothetical protein
VYARLAWCESCEKIVEAEDLPSPEEIEWEVRRVANEKPFDIGLWHKREMERLYSDPDGFNAPWDKLRHEIVKLLGWPWEQVSSHKYHRVLRAIRQWRTERQSGAKCLHCGSPDILPLEEDQEDKECWGRVPHLGCGGMIRAVCDSHASMAESWDEFSPEGTALDPGGSSLPE